MSVTQVQTTGIADNAVTSIKIPNGAVGTTEIADGAVTAAKIGFTIDSVPTGAVFHFASSTAPTGYLKCNGNTIPNGTGTVQGITANFSALYAIIGSTYGSAGKLPDLRGEFVRGWDDTRGIDIGRGFGSFQDQQSRLYKAISNGANAFNVYRGGPFNGRFAGKDVDSANYTLNRTFHDFQDGLSGRGLLNTHPRNIALLACIKF